MCAPSLDGARLVTRLIRNIDFATREDDGAHPHRVHRRPICAARMWWRAASPAR